MAKKPLPSLPCETCGQRFAPSRTWQVYCSDSCRKQSTSMSEYSCEYCGLVSNTIDHIPPITARPTLIELGLAGRYPFVEVRCCKECNCLLGHLALWTVKQRKDYIKKRLRQRYKKYLAIPDWTENELARLEDTFRDFILHGLAVRDLVRLRLKH